MTIGPKESYVVNACIRWLHQQGCFIWRNNSGGYKTAHGNFIRFGLKGSPDIVGATPLGRFIGVECKAGRNKLTDDQIAFRDKMQAKGGIYIEARTLDDLEAMKAVILGNMGEMG